MNWEQLLSAERVSVSHQITDIRSEFQKDYDRIIFSGPFRRLQNKTQVFPLPGSIFVHNRLTHSLEVASVGRSLANLVARKLTEKIEKGQSELFTELGSIVSAACLAHDLGNPPFGHSGEVAISQYFSQGNGKSLKNQLADDEWSDLTSFEGNANAFRILTHQFNGRRKGGYALTFASLASMVKYPYPSFPQEEGKNKYGFFKSETETFKQMANRCGIPLLDAEKSKYARHPLAFLVEAADDISYLIMDIEDAHKLRILSTEETDEMLSSFFVKEGNNTFFEHKNKVYQEVTDTNERIAFLRASVINLLVTESVNTFFTHYAAIMEGSFHSSLVKNLDPHCQEALNNCRKHSVKKIYRHPSVVKIELTGFSVLGILLDEFISAVLDPQKPYHAKLLTLLPAQFASNEATLYAKLQSVLDFISGMTDLYAMQLYKDLKGIQ